MVRLRTTPDERRGNHGTKRTEASEEQQEGPCKELERKARRQASQEEQVVAQKELVGPVGIEPTTHGLKVRCSNQLS